MFEGKNTDHGPSRRKGGDCAKERGSHYSHFSLNKGRKRGQDRWKAEKKTNRMDVHALKQ